MHKGAHFIKTPSTSALSDVCVTLLLQIIFRTFLILHQQHPRVDKCAEISNGISCWTHSASFSPPTACALPRFKFPLVQEIYILALF